MKGYISQDGNFHIGQSETSSDLVTADKSHSHEMQRREFAKEIIQPHIGDKPNPAFIKAYPDISKEYFTQEQIDEGLRSL